LNQQNQRSSKIPLQQEEAATMAECEIQKIDPETEFLLTKKETGNEWETFKENVRPLKRGRNVNILNNALKSNTDNHLKKSLLDERRFLL
jgi:checkpoint serine/threonine-protein kinase